MLIRKRLSVPKGGRLAERRPLWADQLEKKGFLSDSCRLESGLTAQQLGGGWIPGPSEHPQLDPTAPAAMVTEHPVWLAKLPLRSLRYGMN